MILFYFFIFILYFPYLFYIFHIYSIFSIFFIFILYVLIEQNMFFIDEIFILKYILHLTIFTCIPIISYFLYQEISMYFICFNVINHSNTCNKSCEIYVIFYIPNILTIRYFYYFYITFLYKYSVNIHIYTKFNI
jgi:hypothetical protein